MKFKALVATALLSAASIAGAVTVSDQGEYTVTYDETTVFGHLSGSFGAGATRGFSWTVPADVQLVSFGTDETVTFDLPSFTVTAKPSTTLKGPLKAFLGNLVFNDIGGATTTLTATGDVSLDGAPAVTAGGALGKTILTALPGYEAGYFSGTESAPYGSFTSLTVSGASITLTASGGTFSSIIAQPQNKLEFSFEAVAVPEPQTYAMLLAGIATLGWLGRRRQRRD